MRDSKRDRVAELLRVASRLSAPARAPFLERAEPGQRELREEVLSLLSHDSERGELAPSAIAAETRTGPWQLIDPLGDAPPARLFRARRRDDPTRRAILAVLEAPTAGVPVAAALERQARAQRDLALPGLARLLEAGSPEGAWLFAAFEVLDGVPLAEMCDALRLDLVGRVTLVEEVARIVAHVHARGVAPLGLLPWSVLGTWHEGRPRAALLAIDPWPLLALLDPEARPRRGLLSALETSAPEALRGEARGVASDVFSLGALAFEVFTGTPPLGIRRLAGQRSLREELSLAARLRPPPASARVNGLGRAAEALCHARATTPRELCADLRSGLDASLAWALDADPARRPASAAVLADALAAWRATRGPGGGLLNSARGLARRLGWEGGH